MEGLKASRESSPNLVGLIGAVVPPFCEAYATEGLEVGENELRGLSSHVNKRPKSFEQGSEYAAKNM